MTTGWRALAGLLLLGLLATGSGCDVLGPRACTEIGCFDSVGITLRSVEGTFPVGRHELFVATDAGGPARHCSIEVSDNPLVPATSKCVGGLNVSAGPPVTCPTTRTADAVTQGPCTPTAGPWEERISLTGIHTRVRIIQRTSAGTFLDRDFVPAYQDSRPNGAECPPVCRGAAQVWSFSASDRPDPGVSCAPSMCSTDDDCAPVRAGARCMQLPLAGPCVQHRCE